MQEKDCYEKLGTSYQTVYNEKYPMNEAERNRHIKVHYDAKVNKLKKFLKGENILQENREKWEQELEECREAYPQIATERARVEYQIQLKSIALLRKIKGMEDTTENLKRSGKEKIEAFKKKYAQRLQKSSFLILDISKERLQNLPMEEKRTLLKNKKEKLIEATKQSLQNKRGQSNIKQEAKEKIEEIEEAYRKMQEIIKYMHKGEYNPNLIRSRKKEDKSLINKAVIRREDSSKQYFCEDKENRNLKIRRTGYIGYQNIENAKPQWVYQYEVERTIDGQKLINTVYSSVFIGDIMFNKEGNLEQYHCIVNKLFSEKVIKNATEFNEGFIGGIEQDEEGNYSITLEKDELPKNEQEMLTAIMIQKQIEIKRQEEKEEKE